MKNIPFLRYCCWSIIQVFIVVVCYRSNVSGEIAQGCVGSQLNLTCEEMKVIHITAVVLGDTDCRGAKCCITDKDCTRNSDADHTTNVRRRCDNKQSCIVDVLKAKTACGFFGSWSNNDFERITFNCTEDPERFTTSRMSDDADSSLDNTTQSSINQTENGTNTTFEGDEQHKDNDSEDPKVEKEWSSNVVAAVMLISSIIVSIVIILVLIKLRRNMRLQRWNSAELSFIDIARNEAIEENENQETSLNQYTSSPSSMSSFCSETSPGITTSEGRTARNCESASHEMPINVVPRKLTKEHVGSTPKEGSKTDITEPEHSSPKITARVYSTALDFEESECTGVLKVLDNNFYCDVETGEPYNAASSQINDYEEVWKQSEYNDVATDIKSQNPELEVYIPFNIALEIAAASALKKDFHAKFEVVTNEGFPSPTYKTMSSGIPEINCVNEPAAVPIWSLATRTISKENLYCDMQWSQLKFKQDAEFEDSARTGSSIDDDIFNNVETRELVETGSSKGNSFKEDRKRSESTGMATENSMTNPTQKPDLEAYNTFKTAKELKDFSEKVDGKGEVSLNYVELLTEMSEDDALDAYYDVPSSELWFTTDDGQTVIDNDIYSH